MKSPEQFGRRKQSFEEVLTRLLSHKDETIRGLASNVEAIHQAQAMGEGTVEDRERMRELEQKINTCLRELGEPEVTLE